MAAVSLAITAGGALAPFETTVLLTGWSHSAVDLEVVGARRSLLRLIASRFGVRMNQNSVPDGVLHHGAGFDDNGVFRTYDVWQSNEHRQRFVKERLEPILA